jgi:protein-serine/threonine kinase
MGDTPNDPSKETVKNADVSAAASRSSSLSSSDRNKVPSHKKLNFVNKLLHPKSPPVSRQSSMDHSSYDKMHDTPKASVKPSSVASATGSVSLLSKYGVCDRGNIGKGATAVVRLAHKLDRSSKTEKLYAVKEYRKRHKGESEKAYMKKLTSEFCISSTFRHRNVVETVDLVMDEQKRWCIVMEYVCHLHCGI